MMKKDEYVQDIILSIKIEISKILFNYIIMSYNLNRDKGDDILKIVIRNVLTGEIVEEIHCSESEVNDFIKEFEQASINLNRSKFQIEIKKDDK